MFISRCLKMQINDQPPDVVAFPDYSTEPLGFLNITEDQITAVNLLYDTFLGVESWEDQLYFLSPKESYNFIGYAKDAEGYGGDIDRNMTFRGFDFESLKQAFLKAEFGETGLSYDIAKQAVDAATVDDFQEVLNNLNYGNYTFVNEKITLKLMPCTDADIQNLQNNLDTKYFDAPYQDALPAIKRFLSNVDQPSEAEGLTQAVDDGTNVLFYADCSLVVSYGRLILS